MPEVTWTYVTDAINTVDAAMWTATASTTWRSEYSIPDKARKIYLAKERGCLN